MDRLPTELLLMVLSEIDDVASLQSAFLSSPWVRNPFSNPLLNKKLRDEVTFRVLNNEIGSDILPEALLTFLSKPLVRARGDVLSKFLNHAKRTRLAELSWSITDALEISRFHIIIDNFSRNYANKVLAGAPTSDYKVPRITQPTPTETGRIQRAFYRFEIFCNLFPPLSNISYNKMKDEWADFFNRFAPWENEQLACIHDFLVREITPSKIQRTPGKLRADDDSL